MGKADVTGEETGKRTLSATVVGVQASEDRSAENNAGKELDAAGAHSNLQGLWIRAYGRVKQRI